MNGDRIAFLAIDRNGNGTIDDGSELFGNHTVSGVSNGFRALDLIAEHNKDGVIDVRDGLFSVLLLWFDRNRNGRTDFGELVPAFKVLDAVGLGYYADARVDSYGNAFRYAGFARRLRPGANGLTPRARGQFLEDDADREFTIYDVFLRSAR